MLPFLQCGEKCLNIYEAQLAILPLIWYNIQNRQEAGRLDLMATKMIANYYAEVDILCIILLIMLTYKAYTSNFITSHKQYFSFVLLSNIVLAASDLIWIFNNGFYSITETFPARGITLSYIFNGLDIVSLSLLGMTWLLFAEVIQGNYLIRSRTGFIAVLLPVVIITALVATTKHTGFMFHVSEQGEFTLGPGYVLQVAIPYGYMFVSLVFALRRTRRAKSQQARRQSLSIVSFAVAPTCAGVAQIILQDMSVLFVGTVVALIYVYISLQEQQVLTDPLTGLNNRRMLDQKITEAIIEQNEGSKLFLLVIDVDNFKEINDRYGHIEGDRALQIVAEALKYNCDKDDFICRTGGDEFVILHHADPEDECVRIIDGITKMLSDADAPYDLTVSIGKQCYTHDMKNWKSFMDAADEEMYRIKCDKKTTKP